MIITNTDRYTDKQTNTQHILDLHGIQGVHCKHRQTDRQTNTDKYTKHPGLTQGVQKAMVITKTNIPYSAFSKQNI